MKKGFTLIELVIVILVIGLLFAFTLNISRSRIGDIQIKQDKEDFLNAYHAIVSQSLSSKYYSSSEVYSGIIASFNSGATTRQYEYTLQDGSLTGLHKHYLKHTHISALENLQEQKETYEMNIHFKPYTIGCQANSSFTPLTPESEPQRHLQLQGNQSDKTYCFSIDPATCKLQEQKCH